MKHGIILAAAMLLALVGTRAEAQNDSKLGTFFRQVGERATGMNMSDELIVSMPPELARLMEVTEVCGQRDTATGEVTVNVTVEPRKAMNGKHLRLGGEESDYATDTQGRRYSVVHHESHTKKEQRMKHGEPTIFQFSVKDLPKGTKIIEVLSLAFSVGQKKEELRSTDRGLFPITLRNVKIEEM